MQRSSSTDSMPKFDIENLDLWTLHFYRRHTIISSLIILVLVLISLAPFVAEFFMEERLITQADVYATNRVLFVLHLFTDIAIGLSYAFITAVLIYLTVKAGRAIPFLWAFVAFGVFIVACGMTHFMEAFVLWQPMYWVAGGIKWITAVVSVGTAITIPFLVPRALQLIEVSSVAAERKKKLEAQNAQLAKQKVDLEEKTVTLERTMTELRSSSQELERINQQMVDREGRMVELKKEIEELRQELQKHKNT